MDLPPRTHFQHLIEDSCSGSGPVEAYFSGSRVYFIKPLDNAVLVCFPVHFSLPDDIAIGKTFLEQFTEARKKPALGMSPSCSYEQVRMLEDSGACLGGKTKLMLELARAHRKSCRWQLIVF